MFRNIKAVAAAIFGCGLVALSAQAQTQEQAQTGVPTFPTYTPEAPQRIGIISRLGKEQKATLVRSIDAADLYGLFPPDLEARGKTPYGIILYVLSDWSDVEKIPEAALPRAALPQLRAIDPSYFRYAIPVRNSAGRTYVLMFYVAHDPTPQVLQCLAQDLVVVVHTGFASGDMADCARG